jgi:hypothetical protein
LRTTVITVYDAIAIAIRATSDGAIIIRTWIFIVRYTILIPVWRRAAIEL